MIYSRPLWTRVAIEIGVRVCVRVCGLGSSSGWIFSSSFSLDLRGFGALETDGGGQETRQFLHLISLTLAEGRRSGACPNVDILPGFQPESLASVLSRLLLEGGHGRCIQLEVGYGFVTI